jgi:hypothetical protein
MQAAQPRLWLGDLQGSTLPGMLAEQTGGVAYLRIDGVMQGSVSLEGAATASLAALHSCTHRP